MTGSVLLHRTSFALLLAAVALAPLPFGGSTAWFDGAFATGMGLLLAIWAVAELGVPRNARRGWTELRPLRLPACLYAIVLLWCIAQACLPTGSAIAPQIWREAAPLLGIAPRATLSINPEAGIRAVLRLAGYAAVFFLCARYARNQRRAHALLTAIVVASTACALYGLLSWTLGNRTVFWYERTFEAGNLSATFPNRNAFADYATLGLISALALIHLRARPPTRATAGWLWTLAIFIKYVLARSWLLLYASLSLLMALLLTHSRAGLAAAAVAVAIFYVCAARNAPSRRPIVVGGILICLIAGSFLWIAGAGLTERLGKLPDASAERLAIYRLTAGLIADRPLLGTGLGTFADVFPTVRTPDIRPRIDFAHNSYIENALEMGLPAAGLFYLSLGLLLAVSLRAQLRGACAQPWPALAIAAATLSGTHSLFDYAVQFPAVAITLAALLGTATARVLQPRDERTTE